MNLFISINYGAAIIAAVVNMALGMLWYGPLFGKAWIRLSGKIYILAFAGSLVMSCVLAYSVAVADTYLGLTGLGAGLLIGLWKWLGFVAPVTLGVVLWEGKSWKLWFLNAGYYLAALMLMGSIIALLS